MSRRVSLLARVDQIVAKGDWSRERAQQRQAHHVHTRTSDKRGKRLLGTQATIEYYSHQLKKQDKAPKTPQNSLCSAADVCESTTWKALSYRRLLSRRSSSNSSSRSPRSVLVSTTLVVDWYGTEIEGTSQKL